MTSGFRLSRLSPTKRRALAFLLLAASGAFFTLLVATYFQLTSPSSYVPSLQELGHLPYREAKPRSRLERLLESSEGEMNRGGTMRPAFTDQSLDWESLTKPLDAAALASLLAEREGERLALLDWARSGGNALAYERDDYSLQNPAAVERITANYQILGGAAENTAPKRVRIRSLLTDRCVSCHGPDGRHDTARFIELNSCARLATHLVPEREERPGRGCFLAALIALYPLALLASGLFLLSRRHGLVRIALATVSVVALFALTAAWIAGPTAAPLLFTAAAIGTLSALFQALASLQELLITRSLLNPEP